MRSIIFVLLSVVSLVVLYLGLRERPAELAMPTDHIHSQAQGQTTGQAETAAATVQFDNASPGYQVYRSRGCATCHGADALGSRMGPSLADARLHYDRASLTRYLKDPEKAIADDPRLLEMQSQYPRIQMPAAATCRRTNSRPCWPSSSSPRCAERPSRLEFGLRSLLIGPHRSVSRNDCANSGRRAAASAGARYTIPIVGHPGPHPPVRTPRSSGRLRMPTRAWQTGFFPARVYPVLTLVALFVVVMFWRSGDAVTASGTANRPAVTRDLTGIQASRSLRVLMTNSSSSYYVLRGEEYGFEYELANQVARELDLHLRVVLPDDVLTPLEMLQSGLVDVIAMPVLSEDRIGSASALTVPYHSVQQRLAIHRDQAENVAGLRDMHGLQIAARRYSSGERELSRLRRLGVDLVAVLYGPEIPQEQLLDLVADGTYPAAIALDVEVEAAQRFREELYASVALGPRKDVHWAVRENSPELLAALNEALLHHVHRNEDGRLVRSEFYNVVRARYFENTPRAGRHLADPFLLSRTGRISPYDRLFRKAGSENGFDWRLLAALSFQESRFDPHAESWAGAYGLMQLKPRTAGVSAEELNDPKLNVKLGSSHLRMLYERYEGVPEKDRMRFALAAYNCGQGHLDDARKLSALLGRDPDVWEGSVRESLLLLRQPKYHRMVRYGYVRGNETVGYVRQIEQRFALLKQMVATARPVRMAASGPDTVLDDDMVLTAPSMD